MSPLVELRRRLADRSIPIQETERSLTVVATSPDGFDVSLHENDDALVVCFGPWHEHFERADVENAFDCFAFGLSEKGRLLVLSRGTVDYRWTLQTLEDGEWRSHSTTGLLFYPYWRTRRARYLRNRAFEERV